MGLVLGQVLVPILVLVLVQAQVLVLVLVRNLALVAEVLKETFDRRQ